MESDTKRGGECYVQWEDWVQWEGHYVQWIGWVTECRVLWELILRVRLGNAPLFEYFLRKKDTNKQILNI